MSLVFQLPPADGGYCNHLWRLLGNYLVAKLQGKEFILDSSVWIFKNKNGWDDYFDPKYITLKKHCKSIQEPIQKNIEIQNLNKISRFTLLQYREAFEKFMVLNSSLQTQLNDTMNRFNLTSNNYDAIMIRRGSKLFNESYFIKTEAYLNKLIEKDTKIIFLQTDDYNCYEELLDIIEKRKLNIKLYTICPEYKRGGTTVYSRELEYIKKNIKRSRDPTYINKFIKSIKKCEQEYTPEEMKIHMEEMIVGLEICLKSRYLSTDLQSNITRMLYTRHNNINNVLTTCNSLKPQFNKLLYNPASGFY